MANLEYQAKHLDVQTESNHQNSKLERSSSELAENNRNDEKNQNCNDGNGDYPIRSHPVPS